MARSVELVWILVYSRQVLFTGVCTSSRLLLTCLVNRIQAVAVKMCAFKPMHTRYALELEVSQMGLGAVYFSQSLCDVTNCAEIVARAVRSAWVRP
jgi:hypothetical protein